MSLRKHPRRNRQAFFFSAVSARPTRSTAILRNLPANRRGDGVMMILTTLCRTDTAFFAHYGNLLFADAPAFEVALKNARRIIGNFFIRIKRLCVEIVCKRRYLSSGQKTWQKHCGTSGFLNDNLRLQPVQKKRGLRN